MASAVDINTQLAFVEECDRLLPGAAQEKNLENTLSEIVVKYPFGKVTARRILKEHGRSYKPPAKKRERKGQIRLSLEEKQKLVDAFESHGWGPTEIINNSVLGDRTPSKSTISNILRRGSEKYRSDVHSTHSKISCNLRKEILELHKNSKSVGEIEQLLSKNTCRQTILNVIAESGVDVSQGKTNDEKLLIYNTYLKWGTEKAVEALKEIGMEKISATTITRVRNELELPVRDNSVSYRKYELDESIFEKIDSEIKAYALGFIAADGNVTGRTLSIEVKRSDKCILERFQKDLFKTDRPIEPTLHYHKKYEKHHLGSRLSVCSRNIVGDLYKLGIIENKSLTLEVNMEFIPDNLLRHFWRGAVDGDGSLFEVRRWGKMYRTIELNGTKGMVEKWRLWVEEKIGALTPHAIQTGSIWRVTYQQLQQSKEVSKLLYLNSKVSLPRKTRIAKRWWKSER